MDTPPEHHSQSSDDKTVTTARASQPSAHTPPLEKHLPEKKLAGKKSAGKESVQQPSTKAKKTKKAKTVSQAKTRDKKSKKATVEFSEGAKQVQGATVLQALEKAYAGAKTELSYRTPFELLIATILSAQATDVSVNQATPALFAAFPDATAMAQASPDMLEPYIRTIGLYRNKAKFCVGAAEQLVAEHGGVVPEDFAALTSLPGVGRKTANVVLASAYGRPAIAVDTHVGRLARRLGLSGHTNPDKVEKDLEAVFPKERWIFVHHALILHGRRVCHARKAPECDQCVLQFTCPSSHPITQQMTKLEDENRGVKR